MYRIRQGVAVATKSRFQELKGLVIHLAEDEFINRRMISAFLEERGAAVTLSENGVELLTTMEKDRGDCIIMDVRMPVMDGLEATKKIRSLELKSGKHIPIVALTAQAGVEFKEKCLQAGMDAYLTKPVAMSQLVKVLLKLRNT